MLHAIAETEPNARKIVDSPEWRLFLMGPADVEQALFRLHQFRRVHYEVAGSLAQLNCRAARRSNSPGGSAHERLERAADNRLEPILESADPRPAISTYHDMPFAIFHYPAADEFAAPRRAVADADPARAEGQADHDHLARRAAPGRPR